MGKSMLMFILLAAGNHLFGQNSITFQVEDLSKPEKPAYMSGYDQLYERLLGSDVGMYRKGNDFPYNIIAKSEAPDSRLTINGKVIIDKELRLFE